MPVILITGNSMGLGYATAETLACNGHTVYATMVDWDDRSYYCGGTVPQGSKVRFSIAPDFDVIEKVINGCEDLKATEMPEADALLSFNCAGRLLSLGL